jgi:hypothetical protein
MRKRGTTRGLRTWMRTRLPAKVLLSLVFLLLASCAPPGKPLIGPVAPPPPGMARLVVYRPLEYYGTQTMPRLYLNAAPAGVTQNGGVLVRDVLPGTYLVSVAPSEPYPGQFKTIAVRPGDMFFVNIQPLPSPCTRIILGSTRCSGDTFIVTVVDPQVGLPQVQGLRLLAAEGARLHRSAPS